MLALGNLAFAGVLLLVAGAWAALWAAAPPLNAVLVGCGVLQAVSLGLAFASWQPSHHRDGEALFPLCISWAATLPGLLLAIDIATRSTPPGPGDLLLMINLLWCLLGPYLFVTSALTSSPRGALRSLTAARMTHVVAWMASSFVTISCWS